MKRLLDIIGSIIGVFILILIFPFVIIAILFEDGPPFIVKLNRVSSGKTIRIYKFRSMKKDAEKEKNALNHLNERNDGPFFKLKDDPRITKVGKFLRKNRLDEFPQFLNVLKGELSLVGPRPHEPEELFNYPNGYRHLLIAKTGLTGPSQISAKPTLPFKTELELDDAYTKKHSIFLDLKIILKTLIIILTRHDGI